MAKQVSKEELLGILDNIAGVPFLVVGDVILDRYVFGRVERISPEAPVPVLDVKNTEDRLGGASNVARNLRALGATVSLCGFIGDDEEGKNVLGLLEKDGIQKDGIIVDRSRPTILKTRVVANSQQICRIDRESKLVQSLALQDGFASVVKGQINSSRAVFVSDYGKGAVSESVFRVFDEARSQKRLGLDVRPLIVDPHPANYDIYRGLSIAKPNRKEAEAASGIRISDQQSAIEAAKILLKKWEAAMMLISLSEDGLVVVSSSGEQITLPTAALQVFDVSGAGDTVASVFSAAITVGASTLAAGTLANMAAAIVVSEMGTVAVNLQKLRREIEVTN